MAVESPTQAVRRSRNILGIRWDPTRDTVMALASYLIVVGGLFIAFQVFTTENVAGNFITFGPVTLAGLGVGIPLLYTVLVRRRPVSDVGITTRYLIPSIVLGLLLGAYTYQNTLATSSLAWTNELVPLVAMALTVGLFEAVFFRGWLQLRFEAAFGVIPGLFLGALCYSLYHIGYGMEPGELVTLFVLGVVFAGVFRLTRNVAVLWPFYTPVGGFYATTSDGLTMPFEATYGFLLTLGLMAAIIGFAASRRSGTSAS